MFQWSEVLSNKLPDHSRFLKRQVRQVWYAHLSEFSSLLIHSLQKKLASTKRGKELEMGQITYPPEENYRETKGTFHVKMGLIEMSNEGPNKHLHYIGLLSELNE